MTASTILLVGKPNSGKSLLFNRLTGLSQKVANFPGVTVEIKRANLGDHVVMDFPGIYSINPLTVDEEVAVKKLREELASEHHGVVVCILDGTRLEHSLLLGLQVQRLARISGRAFIFVINMLDELEKNSAAIDCERLAGELGSMVMAISAKTGKGLSELKRTLADARLNPTSYAPDSRSEDNLQGFRHRAKELSFKYGPKIDVILKNQTLLDRFFLSSWLGGIVFLLIMTFMFQAIFTWAAPLMDFVELAISTAGEWIAGMLPEGVLSDFVRDAIFAGIGSFLVFVPQIIVLTLIIGILEDSGYLARAAIICHRPLSIFGLSGRSFVPLLSGHACAIPAIFASRTIESPKKRLLTIIGIPLMSCSARLPVYGLLIVALIPSQTYFGGLLGLQGLTFFALYVFGLLSALLVTSLLANTVYKKTSDAPFIIELPPYRMPSIKPLLRRSFNYAAAFVTGAGGVIFSVSVIVWVLGYFPGGNGQLENSWLATLGHWIEPFFRPLGLDWKYGVAVLASFLAREVFVGTLGTLFGIEGADERISDLATRVQNSGLTLASGIALLAFYALAMQCVSTLAVIRKETGSVRLPVGIFVGYSLLAYGVAWLLYNVVNIFS